jgi:hypothetical protein
MQKVNDSFKIGLADEQRISLTDAFTLARSIQEFSASTLAEFDPKLLDELELLQFCQAMRARSFFDGIISLVELGLGGPSAALVRCLFEQQFVAKAISIDRKNARDWVLDHEARRKATLEAMKKAPNGLRARFPSSAEIDALLRDIDPAAKQITYKQWAKRAGFEYEYMTQYAYLSKHIHASLRSVEDHLQLDHEQNVVSVKGQTDERMFSDFVLHSCRIMIFMLGALHARLTSEQREFLRSSNELVEKLRDE